jgi:uncharacterized membrane protein
MKDLVVPGLAVTLILVWLGVFWRIVRSLKKAPPSNADALTFVFSTVGAMITGLSIAQLGIKDKDKLAGVEFGSVLSLGGKVTDFHAYVSEALLCTWLFVGVWSVYIWLFDQSKSTNPAAGWDEGVVLVQNHAKAWIGFAVAAVIAYVGPNSSIQ